MSRLRSAFHLFRRPLVLAVVLPLLSTSGAYLHARLTSPGSAVVKAPAAHSTGPRLQHATGANSAQVVQAVAALLPPLNLDNAASVRAHFLAGMAEMPDDIASRISPPKQLHVLARALGGLEHAAGVDFVTSHLPQLKSEAFAGWAAIAPDEALAVILSATEPRPCDACTLMELLDLTARLHPDSLRETVERVPWQLIEPADLPFSREDLDPRGFALSHNADLPAWIESGALGWLAGKGIHVEGDLILWMNQIGDANRSKSGRSGQILDDIMSRRYNSPPDPHETGGEVFIPDLKAVSHFTLALSTADRATGQALLAMLPGWPTRDQDDDTRERLQELLNGNY